MVVTQDNFIQNSVIPECRPVGEKVNADCRGYLMLQLKIEWGNPIKEFPDF